MDQGREDSLPLLAWSSGPGQGATPSQAVQARIDEAIEHLAKTTYADVVRLLHDKAPGLHALAAALLERETIDGSEAKAIVSEAMAAAASASANLHVPA